MATRPALFEMTSNFNSPLGRARIYRITEPVGVYVVDATTVSGRDPGLSDRSSVSATIAHVWTGSTATDYRGRNVYRVITCGVSRHGNSFRCRDFETVDEADRYLMKWARRRWRVAL